MRRVLPLAVLLALAAPGLARAASLVEVTSFGSNPTGLRMHLYVPDGVGARPAVLVAAHPCGGSGPQFYSSSEFATLANQYKFIVIYPSARTGTGGSNCFDVHSASALRHDGNSDPVSVVSMVRYVLQTYGADPARVFATGSSSGAMFTNVLLGDYPDVFAAGAAFMGVPFSCMSGMDPNGFVNDCSSGRLVKTAQQWGDLVRAASPGFTGTRPRMQLWHGTTDTVLNYANLGEEIKQWTNVLGVSQTASLTDAPRSGWTRTRYGGTGVMPPVEAISIQGVGHALPQSGQAAMAIAFFGLDQTGPGTSYTLTVAKAGTGTGNVTSSTGGINCGSTCSASIASGTVVTLTAMTTGASSFAGWSGACTGTGPCVVTMTAARTVTATFNPGTGTTFPLTVTKSGAGTGTVTSSTGGINCGSTCSTVLASGTAVTLTATALTGSAFGGWSGACVGTGTCIVTMTAAQSVTASFTQVAGGPVSVNAGGAAAGAFLADAYYTGGSTYSNTRTIDTSLLSGAVPPQAVFQTERYGEFTYTIPASASPGSPYDVTLYFAETYWTAAGQRRFNVAVNGTAVLTGFDIFAAAGGANKAIARTFRALSNANGQIVIQLTKGGGPDNPKLCGLALALASPIDMYTLTVRKAGTGSGTVAGSGISCGATCSASFTVGTSVTLTATAAADSEFGGWSGDCAPSVAPSTICLVTISATSSVTATFQRVTGGNYPLTVAKAGAGTGTVTASVGGISCGSTCSASIAGGTVVTLTAAASAGSTFGGWSGDCAGAAATCTVTMTAARTVTATFNGGGTTCTTATGGQSGNFNTTGAVCYTVNATINGWGCSNTAGRSVTVNGTAVTCGQMPLPGGAPYTFSFTAGTYPWASFYWW